jgi:3-mercaptopyruvate sulfurtransferase SseA
MQSSDNVGQTKWILLVICLYAYWNVHKEGGHIPRASNIPWARAINDSNGRFKRFVELKATLSRNGIMRIRK